MKFINYLSSIVGIEIFPLISFMIFFVFFALLIFWALRVNKNYINTLKHLPFNTTEGNVDKITHTEEL